MWFADWQGTPVFVALLTGSIIAELFWNQILARVLHDPQLRFDPSTWILNLSLSLLAAYAASLSVMGSRVQTEHQNEQLDRIEGKLDQILKRRARS